MKKKLALALCLSFLLFVQFAMYQQAQSTLLFSHTAKKTGKAETLSWTQKLSTLLYGVQNPKPYAPATLIIDSLKLQNTYLKSGIHTIRVASQKHPQPQGDIILFHGYASSSQSLVREGRYFYNLGYSIHLVDFYGSGQSSGSSTSIGYYEALDVANVYRWLSPSSSNIILFGESMGAAAIIRAMATHNLQPQKLILESSFDRLETTVANRFKLLGIPAWGLNQNLLFYGGLILDFDPFTHNPIEQVSSIQTPLLYMAAGQDRRVFLAESRQIFQSFGSPNKEFVLFENSKHQSLIKADSAKWKQFTQDFLTPIAPLAPATEPAEP
jgi:alpha-beta hydrolase superfamily lysophospholipase